MKILQSKKDNLEVSKEVQTSQEASEKESGNIKKRIWWKIGELVFILISLIAVILWLREKAKDALELARSVSPDYWMWGLGIGVLLLLVWLFVRSERARKDAGAVGKSKWLWWPVIIVLLIIAYYNIPSSWWENGQEYLSKKASAYQAPAPMVPWKVPAEVALPIIAQCESGGRQFDESGVKPLLNQDGHPAIGKYQIWIPAHDEDAKELGLDIRTLEGNEAFAKILYSKEGLGPWEASRQCWEPRLMAMGYGTRETLTDLSFTKMIREGQPVFGVMNAGWRMDWWGNTTRFNSNVSWRGQKKVRTFTVKPGIKETELKVHIYPCSTEDPC